MKAKRVIVVGAGPGGVVTLKTLLDASSADRGRPLEPLLFEAEDQIGGTFLYRQYENAELVSSRQLTAFSDFRIPPSRKGAHGDHISLEEYVEYLKVASSTCLRNEKRLNTYRLTSTISSSILVSDGMASPVDFA